MSDVMQMTSGDVLNASRMLAQAQMDDPVLAMANAVYWLCPAIQVEKRSWLVHNRDEYEMDPLDDPVAYALLLCLDLFPEVYTEAIEELHKGNRTAGLEQVLLNGIDSHLVNDIDDLEFVQWGIPFEAAGFDLSEESGFWEDPNDWTLLCANLDVNEETVGEESDRIWWKTARHLIDTLIPKNKTAGWTPDPNNVRHQIAHTLAYLFGITGNSVCDTSMEALNEGGMDLLQWNEIDLQFSNDMHEEAYDIMAQAHKGLRYLWTHQEWMDALISNWQRVKRSIKRGHTPSARACRWPSKYERSDGSNPAAVS